MPTGMSIHAFILGAVTGFFPIGWIILNIIFLYRLTVEKGQFAKLRQTIGSVTDDRRIQLLLIAFASAPLPVFPPGGGDSVVKKDLSHRFVDVAFRFR